MLVHIHREISLSSFSHMVETWLDSTKETLVIHKRQVCGKVLNLFDYEMEKFPGKWKETKGEEKMRNHSPEATGNS